MFVHEFVSSMAALFKLSVHGATDSMEGERMTSVSHCNLKPYFEYNKEKSWNYFSCRYKCLTRFNKCSPSYLILAIGLCLIINLEYKMP